MCVLCVHGSFLEPPRLLCSLISTTFLVNWAELTEIASFKKKSVYVHIDFLFYVLFLEPPNISMGLTLPAAEME